MRYERKYRVDVVSPRILKQVIQMHPSGFRTAYPDRRINNIYFDTPLLNSYYENIDGIAERRKYRLRWYGDSLKYFHKPVLEIKAKKSLLGAKKSFPLPSFNFAEFPEVCKKLEKDGIKPALFQPVLFNSYLRSYYVSFNGLFRLTVDEQLSFGQYDRHRVCFNRKMTTVKVLELKYPSRLSEEANVVMQYLPFR